MRIINTVLITLFFSATAFGQFSVDPLTVGGDFVFVPNVGGYAMSVGDLRPTASGSADTVIVTGSEVQFGQRLTFDLVWRYRIVSTFFPVPATATVTITGTVGSQTISHTTQIAPGDQPEIRTEISPVILSPDTTTLFHADVTLSCSSSPQQQFGVVFDNVGVIVRFAPLCNAQAGTITANPMSGVPGSTVTVTGDGWNNRDSGTEYRLVFDGKLVASQGSLTCNSQPDMTFDIPCETLPGTYTIINQLVDSSTGAVIVSSQLVQCTVTIPTIGSLATSCQNRPKVTFKLAKTKMPLVAPLRVGISTMLIDSSGKQVENDRRISLEAVVDPPSARDELNIMLVASPKLRITDQKKAGKDIISFNLDGVGQDGSDVPGDQEVAAFFSDGTIIKQKVTVVVPFKLGQHTPATSSQSRVFMVTPFNLARNATTILPDPSIPDSQPPEFICGTVYAQPFVIKVLDKWGMEIGDLYDGSIISESITLPKTGQVIEADLNVRLGVTPDKKSEIPVALIPTVPSSAYIDFVGAVQPVKSVVGKGPAMRFNESTDYEPLEDDQDFTQELPVKVDGFLLQPSPAITKRHVVIKKSDPTKIMIDWP